MDACQIMTNFRKWGGTNYRVEGKNPGESAKYKELIRADENKDGSITIVEYLLYLKVKQPQINIPHKTFTLAESIDLLMNAEEVDLRLLAVQGIFDSGNICGALPLIDTVKHDKDPEVRFGAVLAINKIGDKRAVKTLIWALGHDKSAKVRMTAAYVLGELKDKRAIPALKIAMKNDNEKTVRMMATDVLNNLQK